MTVTTQNKKSKTPKSSESSLSRTSATRLAWQRGLLSYKLYDYQRPLYDALNSALSNTGCIKYVLNCSRRYGKSTILCLVALEFAIRRSNAQIRFAAPTAKALRKIIRPIIKMLIQDCPEELRPVWNSQDCIYRFPNGSEWHLAGTDNGNYESLRGTASDLNIVDEAGFCDELEYVVQSVLIPQTLTTGGKTLLASTPPPTPAHDFYGIAQECRIAGHYSEFSIWDNKALSAETVELYARESGGRNSSTFRREYECKFVVDESLSIIPEWRDEYITEPPRDELYPLYHKYVAMDLGVRDFTAGLFAYYDFRTTRLYVEEELTMSGPEMTTPKLSREISSIESRLWNGATPYSRIADNNNLLLLQDLGSLHDMHFNPTGKDTLEAMVNEVRILVGEGRLRVAPGCEKLINCLRYGVFTKDRKQFARTQALGHFDHLAALIYLIRNLDKHTNPIPSTYATSPYSHYFSTPQGTANSANADALRRLFTRK